MFKGHHSIVRPDGSSQNSWLTYVCGHCNTQVSGAVVAIYGFTSRDYWIENKWLLCTSCGRGSVLVSDRDSKDGMIYPGVPFGPSLQGLPDDVARAYEEVRRCMMIGAYTAAELVCRKLLMHVAVEKGAKEGESFASYLEYLEKAGYVTPPMKKWVDLIRQHGNKAAHQLEAPGRERAESTVMFTAELLRLVYEMEYLADKFTTTDGSD